eukprot:TRINITY_DN3847_c0_g2_i1.p1 TRINITY_DN3847_c0_g2~~TRINITY_DN3847_c0_g2_i1.p1  ORF type:complete len:814 (-),score=173.82 TRINITY_DN3847_c0_g2_i1:143-2584(-)
MSNSYTNVETTVIIELFSTFFEKLTWSHPQRESLLKTLQTFKYTLYNNQHDLKRCYTLIDSLVQGMGSKPLDNKEERTLPNDPQFKVFNSSLGASNLSMDFGSAGVVRMGRVADMVRTLSSSARSTVQQSLLQRFQFAKEFINDGNSFYRGLMLRVLELSLRTKDAQGRLSSLFYLVYEQTINFRAGNANFNRAQILRNTFLGYLRTLHETSVARGEVRTAVETLNFMMNVDPHFDLALIVFAKEYIALRMSQLDAKALAELASGVDFRSAIDQVRESNKEPPSFLLKLVPNIFNMTLILHVLDENSFSERCLRPSDGSEVPEVHFLLSRFPHERYCLLYNREELVGSFLGSGIHSDTNDLNASLQSGNTSLNFHTHRELPPRIPRETIPEQSQTSVLRSAAKEPSRAGTMRSDAKGESARFGTEENGGESGQSPYESYRKEVTTRRAEPRTAEPSASKLTNGSGTKIPVAFVRTTSMNVTETGTRELDTTLDETHAGDTHKCLALFRNLSAIFERHTEELAGALHLRFVEEIDTVALDAVVVRGRDQNHPLVTCLKRKFVKLPSELELGTRDHRTPIGKVAQTSAAKPGPASFMDSYHLTAGHPAFSSMQTSDRKGEAFAPKTVTPVAYINLGEGQRPDAAASVLSGYPFINSNGKGNASVNVSALNTSAMNANDSFTMGTKYTRAHQTPTTTSRNLFAGTNNAFLTETTANTFYQTNAANTSFLTSNAAAVSNTPRTVKQHLDSQVPQIPAPNPYNTTRATNNVTHTGHMNSYSGTAAGLFSQNRCILCGKEWSQATRSENPLLCTICKGI